MAPLCSAQIAKHGKTWLFSHFRNPQGVHANWQGQIIPYGSFMDKEN